MKWIHIQHTSGQEGSVAKAKTLGTRNFLQNVFLLDDGVGCRCICGLGGLTQLNNTGLGVWLAGRGHTVNIMAVVTTPVLPLLV